jgi:hypothetical protein
MRTKYGGIREGAATKQNATGTHKAMMTNTHGLASLPRFAKIDTVREYLRTKSRKNAKLSNSHFIRAVNNVPTGNCSVLFNHQMRLALGIQLEMTAHGPHGKRGNPI